MKRMIGSAVMAVALAAGTAFGHCDALDGPVVRDARAALERGDPALILKWVGEADEAALRAAFAKTLAVRDKGAEAKDLADTYFLETLVRLHRAGEGAPFTGLKPAGTAAEPGVAEADAALAHGKPDGVIHTAGELVSRGIQQRFDRAQETRRHADDSPQAGREYVAAYVEYVHYVKRIFTAAGSSAAHAPAAADHGHDTRPPAGEPAQPAHRH